MAHYIFPESDDPDALSLPDSEPELIYATIEKQEIHENQPSLSSTKNRQNLLTDPSSNGA